MSAVRLHHLAAYLDQYGIPFIPRLIYYLILVLFNSSIPCSASIGRGTKLGYGGLGIVIHARAVIGEDCVIAQQVTIGGKSRIHEVPVIGNRVYVGAGARILGNVHIGDDSVVGANAVVLKDVPPGSMVVGVPAKIIKTGIKAADFV
jgi:serine O-acetyltransferase